MTTAQLIKVTEKVIFLEKGIVCEAPKTEQQQLAHIIYKESKVMRTEEIVGRWNLKSKKQADQMFWDYMEENKVDSRNYYLVFA